MNNDWWHKPRKISILVDKSSWMVPYAKAALNEFKKNGDIPVLCHGYDDMFNDGVVFIYSWQKIIGKNILDRNYKNLVVHASNLPKGRGFSPITWQILDGINTIPVCLFEAEEELDAGDIIYKEYLELDGHELIDEIREKLGSMHIELSKRFLLEKNIVEGVHQKGDATTYKRRNTEDSELDINDNIRSQFNLLRVVDNERYPAFFKINGHKYQINIKKVN